MRQFLGECFEIFVLVVILCSIVKACSTAHADTFGSVGLGVFDSAKNSPVETRFFNFGYRDDLILGLSEQYEGGFWLDQAGGGRKGSAYAAYEIGIVVDNQPIVGRVMFGPAIITTPDVYLGSVFPQFTEEAYFGMKSRDGNSIGFKYKHFSSAGISQPNIGRDFVGLEAGIPW